MGISIRTPVGWYNTYRDFDSNAVLKGWRFLTIRIGFGLIQCDFNKPTFRYGYDFWGVGNPKVLATNEEVAAGLKPEYAKYFKPIVYKGSK